MGAGGTLKKMLRAEQYHIARGRKSFSLSEREHNLSDWQAFSLELRCVQMPKRAAKCPWNLLR